jgi:hypothetical protein
MKKLLLALFICTSLLTPKNSYALDAKAKAFAVICGYGTVGGALLGFASMAFGSNSRAIAQGASLGLYAGIIFGTYVLTSYKDPNAEEPYDDPYAPPANDPYAPPPQGGFGSPGGYGAPPAPEGGYGAPAPGGYGAPAGGYGAPVPAPEEQGGFFGPPNRAFEIQSELMNNYQLKKGTRTPPVYLNLMHMQF